MKKIIIKTLEWFYIEHDKALHFVYGFLLTYVFLFLFQKFGYINDELILFSVTSIAILKELFDKYYLKSEFDGMDIMYTMAPSVLLLILV